MQHHHAFVPSENVYLQFSPLDIMPFNHFNRDVFSNEDSTESNGPSLFQKGSWKNAEVDEAPIQAMTQKAPVALMQTKKEDISEKGMDENVHWFANPETETLNWPRK